MHSIRVVTLLATGAAVLSLAGTALADTHAPSAQTFALTCGGKQVTFVSPVGPAEAAQITTSHGVGILEEIIDPAGNVVFQHPGSQALNPAALTSCTDSDGFTFVVLVTPQGG